MSQKYNIPILILNKLEPIIKENRDLIKNIPDKNNLYFLKDSHPASKFFFKVQSAAMDTISNVQTLFADIEYSPNPADLTITKKKVKFDNVEGQFKTWINLIKSYRAESIHDEYDEHAEFYKDEILNEYFPIDESDEFKYYNIETQIKLHQLLEEVKESIENQRTNENNEAIDIIKDLAGDLQNTQGSLTILEVKNRFAYLLGKARARATPVFVEIMKILGAAGAKVLAERTLKKIIALLS